jgi:hypothetical protein
MQASRIRSSVPATPAPPEVPLDTDDSAHEFDSDEDIESLLDLEDYYALAGDEDEDEVEDKDYVGDGDNDEGLWGTFDEL